MSSASQFYDWSWSPIVSGDSGAGIFFRRPNGDLCLVGTVSGMFARTRLSAHWPWMVKTLVNQGLRDDAILLSKKVLGTGNWGNNDRKGELGQIFIYSNPYSREVEYFRANVDGQYGYFPTNKTSNASWTYVGTDLPTRPLKFAARLK